MIEDYKNVNNSPMNNSPSKLMFSFPKSPRFKCVSSSQNIGKFYKLPSVASNRYASFGYGHRYDFTSDSKGKSKVFYNIPSCFDIKKSQIKSTFGSGRDIHPILDKSTPGPAKYNIMKPFGGDACKFSFTRSKSSSISSSNIPGPGQYNEKIIINPKGIYPLSQNKNLGNISFGVGQRFKYKRDNYPGPAEYKLKSLMGYNFNSKYSSHMPISISFKSLNNNAHDNTPGPGKYKAFSEFGSYIKSNNNNKSQIYNSKNNI